MTAYLTIRNLSVALKSGTPILRSISMKADAGQVHALVGESGAGKSMIGKAVLGTLPRALSITEGEIWLDGVNLLALTPAERRKRIGATAALIPQDPLTALKTHRTTDHTTAGRYSGLVKAGRQHPRTGAVGRGAHPRPCPRNAQLSA